MNTSGVAIATRGRKINSSVLDKSHWSKHPIVEFVKHPLLDGPMINQMSSLRSEPQRWSSTLLGLEQLVQLTEKLKPTTNNHVTGRTLPHSSAFTLSRTKCGYLTGQKITACLFKGFELVFRALVERITGW